MASISAAQKMKLQRVQNRAVKFITNRDWRDHESMQTLHERINLPPINQIIHKRAQNTWRAVEKYCPTDFERLSRTLAEEDTGAEHGWFKRTIPLFSQPLPPPRYS